jgi:ABC-type polysaccharide/polyol phosphate export permease
MLLLFMFVWSVAILAGFANVFFNDTQHLSEIGLQILFYATQVIYPPEMLEGRRLGRLIELNPINSFLNLFREPIIHQHWPSLGTFGWAATTALVFAVAACIVLARLQRKLIFKL